MNPNNDTRGFPQNSNQQFPQRNQNIRPAFTSDMPQNPTYTGTDQLFQDHDLMLNCMAPWDRMSCDPMPMSFSGSMSDLHNQGFNESTTTSMARSNFSSGTFNNGTESNILGSRDNNPGTFVNGTNSNILSSPENTDAMTALIQSNKQLVTLMEQNQKLQDSLKTQSEQHQKIVTELQGKITTLEQEKTTLTNQKSTLQRECQHTRNYINMLRGLYDFRIGIDGKLLPLVPETDTIALIAQGAPATPLQFGYEEYLKSMISEYHDQVRHRNISSAGQGILKADICYMCPVHNGPEANFHPSRVTGQPAPNNTVTRDTPAAPSSFHQIALNAARAAVIANANKAYVAESTQVAPQVNDAAVAAAPAETQVNNTLAAAPAQVDTQANTAATLHSRPAPPETPPSSSPEEIQQSLPSLQKKDRNYSWLAKSQNLGLLKAQGKIKDAFEQKEIEDELRLARRAAYQAEILAASTSTSTSALPASTEATISKPAAPATKAATTKKAKAGSKTRTTTPPSSPQWPPRSPNPRHQQSGQDTIH
jgi:hypothetical protein